METNFKPRPELFEMLVARFAAVGKLEIASDLINKMTAANIMPENSFVNRYVAALPLSGTPEAVNGALDSMENLVAQGFRFNSRAYQNIIEGFIGLRDFEKACHVMKFAFENIPDHGLAEFLFENLLKQLMANEQKDLILSVCKMILANGFKIPPELASDILQIHPNLHKVEEKLSEISYIMSQITSKSEFDAVRKKKPHPEREKIAARLGLNKRKSKTEIKNWDRLEVKLNSVVSRTKMRPSLPLPPPSSPSHDHHSHDHHSHDHHHDHHSHDHASHDHPVHEPHSHEHIPNPTQNLLQYLIAKYKTSDPFELANLTQNRPPFFFVTNPSLVKFVIPPGAEYIPYDLRVQLRNEQLNLEGDLQASQTAHTPEGSNFETPATNPDFAHNPDFVMPPHPDSPPPPPHLEFPPPNAPQFSMNNLQPPAHFANQQNPYPPNQLGMAALNPYPPQFDTNSQNPSSPNPHFHFSVPNLQTAANLQTPYNGGVPTTSAHVAEVSANLQTPNQETPQTQTTTAPSKSRNIKPRKAKQNSELQNPELQNRKEETPTLGSNMAHLSYKRIRHHDNRKDVTVVQMGNLQIYNEDDYTEFENGLLAHIEYLQFLDEKEKQENEASDKKDTDQVSKEEKLILAEIRQMLIPFKKPKDNPEPEIRHRIGAPSRSMSSRSKPSAPILQKQ